jgi:hypothetical protein
MTKKSFVRLLTLSTTLALFGSLSAGCKEDPPPPPMPEPAASSKAKVDPRVRAASGIPRISPETMKAYRVESCYFGALGLRLARDAYGDSLGGGEPSADKLPSFGEFPDPAQQRGAAPRKVNPDAEAGVAPERPTPAERGPDGAPTRRMPPALDPAARLPGRPPLMAAGRQLPFVRHIRSCSVAKTLKNPAYPEMDKALEQFDAYVSELNKTILDANRYYARKQYEKDEFKRGKEIHKTLTEQFPKLDGELDAFSKAYAGWIDKHKEPTEKLDKPAETAHAALTHARELTLQLLAGDIDGEAANKTLDQVKAEHEALKKVGEEDKRSPHPRVMLPKLEEFATAADEAIKAGGKLAGDNLYKVTSTMAELIEANQRGLAQMLRMTAQPGGHTGPPMRMLKPRVKGHGAPPAPAEQQEAEGTE